MRAEISAMVLPISIPNLFNIEDCPWKPSFDSPSSMIDFTFTAGGLHAILIMLETASPSNTPLNGSPAVSLQSSIGTKLSLLLLPILTQGSSSAYFSLILYSEGIELLLKS